MVLVGEGWGGGGGGGEGVDYNYIISGKLMLKVMFFLFIVYSAFSAKHV